MRPALLLSAALFAAGLASSALAQDSEATIYEAADFAAFNPQTALDIVERTPGFVLVEGDADVRGLAGSSSNILVDGARPSSKSGGVRDLLRRIPADQVDRVEVLRSANLADAQGQAVVLNIVRRRGGASGTWSAGIERNGRGTVYPRLEATATREVAGWATTVRANGFWEEYPFDTERVFTDVDGAVTSSQRAFLPSTLTEAFLAGEAARDVWGGRLKLTGRFGRSLYYYDQTSDLFEVRRPDGAPNATEILALDSLLWIGEIGFDFARPIGDWSWSAIGLLNAEDNDAEQDQTTRPNPHGPVLEEVLVRSSRRPVEGVLRTRFASPQDGRLRSEFGAEFAYNQLDSSFSLTVDGAVVPVPAADVRVQEWRGEAFANLTYDLTSQLDLEGGLAAEASRITVSGDAENSQNFTFVKPSVAIAWRPRPPWLLRAGVRTTVGQLDFADFAASAELDEDQTQAGNPDIRPGRTVRYSVSADYRASSDLAANIEIFHEDREDVLEQVLLPSGAPGLANAGDATYRGVKATATVPLNTLVPGSRLSVEALVLDTAFTDPITGEERDITGVSSPQIKVGFRRDDPNGRWSWGLDYIARTRQTDFLLDEFTLYTDNAGLGGFVERRFSRGLTARLTVQDIAGQETRRRRSLFDGDRSRALIGFEDRITTRGEFVTFTLTGRF